MVRLSGSHLNGDSLSASMHAIDWALLTIYLASLMAIGIYFSRRQSSVETFLQGDARIGWMAVGLSLMAALNSGMDYIQTPAIVYVFGTVYVALILTWIPLYPWVAWVTVPFYRRLNVVSAYEYLERRFGLGVRLVASTIFVLWRISWMGVALYVPCLALRGATSDNLDVTTLAIILGVVVTGYTMLGGMQAVIWSDLLQFCVMFGGLFATVAIIVHQVPGGLAAVWSHAVESGRLSLEAPLPELASTGLGARLTRYLTTEVTLWGTLCFILIGRMATYTSDQVAVQRFQTMGSYREARNAFIVSALADILWMVVLGGVGLSLFAYFQSHPFPAGLKNDLILPYFMSQHFTAGFIGLVVASILSASLSSVDAALNATTSVIVVDFYNRWWLGRHEAISSGPESEQRRMVWVTRGHQSGPRCGDDTGGCKRRALRRDLHDRQQAVRRLLRNLVRRVCSGNVQPIRYGTRCSVWSPRRSDDQLLLFILQHAHATARFDPSSNG
jgi:solute:Na+ symporter, SSS family